MSRLVTVDLAMHIAPYDKFKRFVYGCNFEQLSYRIQEIESPNDVVGDTGFINGKTIPVKDLNWLDYRVQINPKKLSGWSVLDQYSLETYILATQGSLAWVILEKRQMPLGIWYILHCKNGREMILRKDEQDNLEEKLASYLK